MFSPCIGFWLSSRQKVNPQIDLGTGRSNGTLYRGIKDNLRKGDEGDTAAEEEDKVLDGRRLRMSRINVWKRMTGLMFLIIMARQSRSRWLFLTEREKPVAI